MLHIYLSCKSSLYQGQRFSIQSSCGFVWIEVRDKGTLHFDGLTIKNFSMEDALTENYCSIITTKKDVKFILGI